jgi:hypothetical protein
MGKVATRSEAKGHALILKLTKQQFIIIINYQLLIINYLPYLPQSIQ